MRVVRLRNDSFFRICPGCDERIRIRAVMLLWRVELGVNEYLHPDCYNLRVDAWRSRLAVTTDLHDTDFEWETPGT